MTVKLSNLALKKENSVSFMLDLKWLCIAEAEEYGCIRICILLVKVLVLLQWNILKGLVLAIITRIQALISTNLFLYWFSGILGTDGCVWYH